MHFSGCLVDPVSQDDMTLNNAEAEQIAPLQEGGDFVFRTDEPVLGVKAEVLSGGGDQGFGSGADALNITFMVFPGQMLRKSR